LIRPVESEDIDDTAIIWVNFWLALPDEVHPVNDLRGSNPQRRCLVT
jgi:hypothetical protein